MTIKNLLIIFLTIGSLGASAGTTEKGAAKFKNKRKPASTPCTSDETFGKLAFSMWCTIEGEADKKPIKVPAFKINFCKSAVAVDSSLTVVETQFASAPGTDYVFSIDGGTGKNTAHISVSALEEGVVDGFLAHATSHVSAKSITSLSVERWEEHGKTGDTSKLRFQLACNNK